MTAASGQAFYGGQEEIFWIAVSVAVVALVVLGAALRWLWRTRKRKPQQWFRRRQTPPALPPRPQPTPRPIVGQRPSEPAARPRQREARRGSRSRRQGRGD